MEIFIKQRLPAATIVEYSDQKQVVNRYPNRIVSPSAPSACCSTGMEPVGGEQREREWLFRYMRCRECGYTVRRFNSRDSFSAYWDWDILEPAADAIPASRNAAGMSVPRCLWQTEQEEGLGAQSGRGGEFSGQRVGT